MKNELIVQLGEHIVMTIPDFFYNGRRYEKYFICPHCFKSTHLGRNSENEEWAFERDYTNPPDHSYEYETEQEVRNHIENCKPVLCAGINRVDASSNEVAHYIVDRLSRWANKANGFDLPAITKDHFFEQDIVSYVFVNEVGPVSYVAFMLKDFTIEDRTVSSYVLWDLYTFPPFRNNGYATKLLNKAINDLKIDTSHFPVSFPLTNKSANLVKKISTGKVFAFRGRNSNLIDKNDITFERQIKEHY
ncbi:GNAT family N-acetyltransferase [uncultured Methanolobus sp.]|uniref:GNAT family N-acetyltransferase n=1 Tax=uncultured Methanolobus sp. TaxID=218300 RepID=UPI0029C9AEE1|nr:GNAT family N-acetyltransferase [uncultured Methanolobus sp.]